MFTQRTWNQALLASLAVAGLLLTTACGNDDAPEEATESPENEQTAEDASPDSNSDDAATEPERQEADSESDVFSMEEVAENDTQESCWAVMDNTVYDLTGWIDQHPGGPGRIEQLCGTDATDAFDRQHGGQERPEGELSEFEIGSLEE
ncbi:cytochrome b5 domain-containing protein [Nesterenkonia natronophila]|uniref:Cytochrome b5 domain-containing protein n=2 Tax=Nesterenkonia natronophila TaxID=2174932 RepID=A0A3A4F361_9MICC|nr:cytochrome b5 domain-containing protein [Nesterenkonia natronophila]